tara:strand:+ start:921 stop:1184 length:264 start_codon:yes stop_codon:yes gene_type:complete
MILFGKIIITLGLILFPLVKGLLGGATEFNWVQGFLMGGNYSDVFFIATIEEEKRLFKLHTIQLHLIIFSFSFAWSIEHPDKEIDIE